MSAIVGQASACPGHCRTRRRHVSRIVSTRRMTATETRLERIDTRRQPYRTRMRHDDVRTWLTLDRPPRRAHAAALQSARRSGACSLTAAILAVWPFEIRTRAARAASSTLLSWLPDAVVRSRCDVVARFARLLVAGIVLWAAQRWLALVVLARRRSASPASGRCTSRTTYNTAHIFHMANMLLVIQAIWITADAAAHPAATARRHVLARRRSCRAGSRSRRSPTSASFTRPRASRSSPFSGPGWANGTSLQLWTYLWGRPWSPTTQLILSSRTFTRMPASR